MTKAKVVDPDKGRVGSLNKEHEPGGEAAILGEIIKTSETADREAEGKVKAEISEARRSQPEPEIPPDVADAGVKSPQIDADEVVTKGSTINLPITEETYKKGLHHKVKSVVKFGVVSGVSGVVGLVTWVGKIIKVAHHHAKRVIFRKEGDR